MLETSVGVGVLAMMIMAFVKHFVGCPWLGSIVFVLIGTSYYVIFYVYSY